MFESKRLLGKHFHNGYVVRDVDLAIARMRREFGIANWQITRLPAGSKATALGMAYSGGTMIELVEVDATGELLDIHKGWLPEDEAGARLNHVAYLIDTMDEWRAAMAHFERQGIGLPIVATFGDVFEYFYADTVASLGHFCEFVCLKDGGAAFIAGIPRN